MPEARMTIPKEIRGQKYVSLTTFRKSGHAVVTPVWFAEQDEKLYVMTRSDSGKYKRIRNNPQIKVAPCTMRGKVAGSEFSGTARVLPPEDWPEAKKALHRKYWLSRLPFWSKTNVFLEIAVAG
jgi:PPOX class probable F420-dependent enzyme